MSSQIVLRPSDLDCSRSYHDVLGLAIYREFGPPADPGVVLFPGPGWPGVCGHTPGPAGRSAMIWSRYGTCRIGAEVFVAGGEGPPTRDAPKEKGTAIMKLTTMTQVTVDGVMQGNGGASDEDRRNGFERGGWAMGVFDNETFGFISQTYQRADAFLFGRRTYELFAGYWGVMDLGSGPIADALNTRPKYVASNTLTEPRWADTTVLSGDLAAAIGELKAKPGGELQVHGSGALIRWLLENDLVDEMSLLIVPVVVGQGARLFPATGPDIALDLVESRADSKGVTIQVYRPAGRPQYATG